MDFTLLFVDSFLPLIFNLIIAVVGNQSAIEKKKISYKYRTNGINLYGAGIRLGSPVWFIMPYD